VRQGFFSEAEIRDVLANLPNDGLRDFVEWVACTGQRKGEIASLTWDMVDGSEIRIPGEVCKNRRPRVIPLGSELAEIVARRKKARPDAKKAKCAGKLFHDLRRTCTRQLLAAGVPQAIARELTGHRTSAMFDCYAIVSSADVLAAQKRVTQFRRQA
jgi:integrase